MLRIATYGIGLLIGLVLVAFWWSLRQWEGVLGPTYGARYEDGRVMIASGAALLELDRSGRLQRRIELAALGLGPIVNDLQPLSDGSVLLGDANRGAIVRCDSRRAECITLYDQSGAAGPLARSFKIAPDEARDRIYVSDSQHHRVLILDMDGRVVANSEDTKINLAFPNELILLRSDRLLVANTGNGELVSIDLNEGGFGAEIARLPFNMIRKGTEFSPIAIRRAPDGRLWTVVANNLLETGVVVFATADGNTRTVDLGAATNPLSLTALEDRMLVLDPTNVLVRTVSLDGAVEPAFGDDAFNSALADTAWKRRAYGYVRDSARWVLGTLLIALLVLYALARRRKTAATTVTGIHVEKNSLEGGASKERNESGQEPLLRRYWRGDLPLTVYPASGLVLALVVMLGALPLLRLGGWLGGPTGVALVVLVIWLLMPMTLVLWVVLTWRSAARTTARSPELALQARLIKGIVLIPVAVLGFAAFDAGGPQVVDSIRTIRDAVQGPQFTLRVVGGEAIAVRGRIEFGLVREFGDLLLAHPGIRRVYLDSTGGRAAEAKRVGALIAGRGINTYATGQCYSACILILMAGSERFLVQGALIGLHQPRFIGRLPWPFDDASLLREVREDWVSLGIDPGLVDRALAVPPNRIWRPTVEELIAGKLITGVVSRLPDS